jgi:ABC-2 type transport system ATP-binding protein
LDVLHYTRHGSVANLIVRGDREQTIAVLQAKQPILLDVLPLTLEEVFTYEMEALGYIFETEEGQK